MPALAALVFTLASAGTAHAALYQCTGANGLIFDNWNTNVALNGGKPPTFDTGGKAYCVSQVATYHWNAGKGKTAGTIALVGEGTTVGPFKAENDPTNFVNWIANFSTPSQPVVISGRYSCRDSDPKTWAQNETSKGLGFCRVFAQEATAVSAGLSGTLSAPGSNTVQADLNVGGTQTLTAIRLDLNPAVHHTGASARVNGSPQGSCGPFQGSNTNLVCTGLSAAPGAQVTISVFLDADYPANGGANAYGDPGSGFVGPFFVPGPSPAGTPPPTAVAPPEAEKSVDVQLVSGAVLVKPPGSTRFGPVLGALNIPVGSIVDARKGRVQIRARGPNGEIQTVDAYEGVFKVVQILEKGVTLVTELQLFGGNFKACPKAQRGNGVAPAKAAKSVRHLWADGAGAFRTRGRFSSASIRGTNWDTEDRCDGTLTKVKQGSVLVRDFVKRKSVVVGAGKQYLARAPEPKRKRRK